MCSCLLTVFSRMIPRSISRLDDCTDCFSRTTEYEYERLLPPYFSNANVGVCKNGSSPFTLHGATIQHLIKQKAIEVAPTIGIPLGTRDEEVVNTTISA